MRNFIGRQSYLALLERPWKARKTGLVSVYGRRRVGKTALIRHFVRGKPHFLFEALEGEETPAQISHFLNQLARMTGQTHLGVLQYNNWPPVFDLLTQLLEKEKSLVLCFDELSWMAAGRTRLVSLIKYYWDQKWKNHPHLLFILCGSVASWMVKNVVRSKALYGRISENILVDPLQPFEVASFIGKKRGKKETLEYLLCFGGIPRYLEEFDFNASLLLNVEQTCFQPSGFFRDEADKIFYNQFRETKVYQKIVDLLLKGPLPLQTIAGKIALQSGGGLKLYLDNLESAGIVERIPEIRNFRVEKKGSFYLVDEYLRFYHWFIRSNRMEIKQAHLRHPFEKFTHNKWHIFLGLAFEKFCLKHRYRIADLLGFGNTVIGCGSLRLSGKGGAQFDLVFLRREGIITLCEVKYLSEKIPTTLIHEFEKKLATISWPKHQTIEKVLISNQEPTEALRASGYFHSFLCADRFLERVS